MSIFEDVALTMSCHPEQSEGPLTGCDRHTTIIRVTKYPMRGPSPSARLGMTRVF